MTLNPALVIDARGVSRVFRAQRERRTMFRVMRDAMTGAPALAGRYALIDISLSAGRGDKIAVIGNNGAGKSTLLRIISGLLRPSAGTVVVNGEMVLLTSLSVGMVAEVSVADNTLMFGALYGLDPKRVRVLLPEMLAWAGITGYEHALLKTLSTGTKARLAFSIVRYIGADVFLLDEALSAGDVSFRAKCRAFFDEPQNDDRTFLVATHDMEFALSFCTQAIWIDQGRCMAFGPSSDVVARYLEAQNAEADPPTVAPAAL